MKIDILTLFPNMFDGFLNESIIKRAIESKKLSINIHNIRDYSKDKHKKVDDTPYGGGSGMVLMCQPVFDAVEDLKKDNTNVILMTPQGVQYNQKLAYSLSNQKHIIIICGHYEGFDERIRSAADMEISIGDYVLTGGELPSMVITDSIVRLVEGVIDNESHQKESFNDNLLDYPVYTKPQNFNGMEVPDVLLSGHHENIENWRQTERIIRTMERRPDLIKKQDGYCVTKDNRTKEITYIEYEKLDGLDITPRNDAKRTDVINVTKMILIEPSFIKKVIKKKVEKKFKSLLERATLMLSEDADPNDSEFLLGEFERYKSTIVNNYIKHLDMPYSESVLKKIQLIVNEIRLRRNMYVMEKDDETKGKSR